MARDHRHGEGRAGLAWLDVNEDGIQLGKAPTEAPAVETDAIRISPAPRPEVVFSTPTQDETDVSMGTSVRIQFSRDINQSTLKGHVGALPRVADDRTRRADHAHGGVYDAIHGASRVLELKFTKPLERFRTIHIELDEILGTDKQPLKPWTLSFDLGGAQ